MFFSFLAHAELPQHDVLEDKKEVWMIPVIQIHHTLFLDGRHQSSFLQSRMNPYASSKNTDRMIELRDAYPGYKIRIYRSELRKGKLKLDGLTELDYQYSPSQEGWRAFVFELKIPDFLLSGVQESLSKNSQANVSVSILRNDKFEEVTPEIDYELNTINY